MPYTVTWRRRRRRRLRLIINLLGGREGAHLVSLAYVHTVVVRIVLKGRYMYMYGVGHDAIPTRYLHITPRYPILSYPASREKDNKKPRTRLR